MKVLVTGGAGFIGSHTVEALLLAGHQVRVLDNLDPQVHGGRETPEYLSPEAEFVRGDVRDADVVRRALRDVTAVCHLAARVGVAQSLYEVRSYVEANCVGTATLLEAVVQQRAQITRLVVASSMSLYGEGEQACPACGPVFPELRPADQLARRDWECLCPECRAALAPLPTRESKPLRPSTPYAVTKRDQEELCLSVGSAYGISTLALRYFNVYGPRQALSNPYTGIGAIFASRILNGRPPVVFEDGRQSRDFVHVTDVARANLLALTAPGEACQAVNVGTGEATSVWHIAETMIRLLGTKLEPDLPGKSRAGDIRHCYADISAARRLLGFRAELPLAQGLAELAPWLADHRPADRLDEAIGELESRGLAS